jgi:predicted lipoprotein
VHDCDITVGDAWLARFIKPLLRGSALRNSVVFIVFDEGLSNVGGGGKVFAIALGPLVSRPGG